MSVPTLSETRAYGRLLEYGRERVLPRILSQAIDSQPVSFIFMGETANAQLGERGGSRGVGRREIGGESIVQKVRLGVNNTRKALSGSYDTFDLTPQDNVRHARYTWKQYGDSVNISEHEIQVNSSSPERIADIAQEEMTDAVGSLVDLLADDFYSNNGGGDRINDLDSLISANDSVGGLPGSTYGNWNSRGISARGTAASSVSFTASPTSFATGGLTNWRKAWDNASDGSHQPNVMLTTYDISQFYEAKIQAQERFTPAGMADAGFVSTAFKRAALLPDQKCDSGSTYFINTDFLFLAFLPGAAFGSTPFQMPDAQRVMVSKIFATCQLVITDRKRNNRVTGIVA